MPTVGEEGDKGVLRKVDNLDYVLLLAHSLFEFLFPFKQLPSAKTTPMNGRIWKAICRGKQACRYF